MLIAEFYRQTSYNAVAGPTTWNSLPEYQHDP